MMQEIIMVSVQGNTGNIARISGVYVNELYAGMSLLELGLDDNDIEELEYLTVSLTLGDEYIKLMLFPQNPEYVYYYDVALIPFTSPLYGDVISITYGGEYADDVNISTTNGVLTYIAVYKTKYDENLEEFIIIGFGQNSSTATA